MLSDKRNTAPTEAPDLDAERVAAAREWLGELLGDPGIDPRVPGLVGAVRLATRGATDEKLADLWTGFRAGRDPFASLDHETMLDALAESLVATSGGVDVWACPYPHAGHLRRGGRATVRRHVHADVDGPANLDRLRALGGFAVASGSSAPDGRPHAHVYVRLDRSVTADEHRALCRGLGGVVGGEAHDTSKTGDADLLRIPGTLNHKNAADPRPVSWLVRPDEGTTTWAPEDLARLLDVDLEAVEEVAARVDEDRATATSGVTGDASARLAGIVRAVREAPRGEGNNKLNWAAWKAAAILATDASAGDEEAVRAALIEAYLERPTTERADARRREAVATIASGWRWGAQHPSEALRDRGDRRPRTATNTENIHDAEEGPAMSIDERTGEVAGPASTMTGSAPTVPCTPWLNNMITAAAWDDDTPPTPPEVGRIEGTDGALFASGRVSRVFGLSGSGKSWLAKGATVEQLNSGARVLYLDVDGVFDDYRRHLKLLGVDRGAALSERHHYARVEGSLVTAAALPVLQATPWDLVVLDGWNAALGLAAPSGRSGLDAPEVDAFIVAVLNPFAARGAAVVVIDHARKEGDADHGSVQKRNSLTGTDYMIRRRAPIAAGVVGYSELRLTAKDRPGWATSLHARSGRDPDDPFVYLVVDSTAEGRTRVAVQLDKPHDVAVGAALGELDRDVETLRALLRLVPAGFASMTKVREGLTAHGLPKLDATRANRAAAVLVSAGEVTRPKGPRGAEGLRPAAGAEGSK